MSEKITKLDLFFVSLAVLVLIFIFSGFWGNGILGDDDLIAGVGQSEKEVIQIENPFENIIIEAKSAVVFDIVGNEFIFEKNSETVRPLASLTKLMTAFTALQNYDFDNLVIINSSDLVPEGDSGLYDNESWSFLDLLEFSLITSSNDGASALASNTGMYLDGLTINPDIGRRVFISEMNKTADKLGMTQSYFLNPTGLDLADDRSGSYGTVRDLSLLMTKFLKLYPEVLYKTKYLESTFISENGFEHLAKNTNQSLDELPVVLGSKTGFTDLAGGNLVLAFDAGFNRPMIVVVLGSTIEGRFTDAISLAKAGVRYLQYQAQQQL